MHHKTAIATAIHLALLGAAAAPSLARAQDAADAERLETITVVGSRIKRTDLETSQPVFVLEREDIQRTGLASIGDILQRLTTNGASLNTTFNNGGNGQTSISLRNLGLNRTLVLVNGRRWVTTLAGAVDLNTIPAAVIERIEVLKDGASSIYGSDAIAGVVNITTRQDYDGGEASAYLGENEEGDGRTESYDFTVGSSSERASAVLSLSYVKQEPVFAGDREVSANPLFGFGGNNVLAGASSTTPFGRFGVTGTPGTVTLIPGRSGTSASDYRPFDLAGDGFNFAPDNYLLTPQERIGAYAQARYELTDWASFRTTMLYSERRSSQQLAAMPLTLGPLFGGFNAQISIPSSNLYNPFGATVTRAQYRNALEKRTFSQDVDTFYFSAGVEGAFDLFERTFNWDVGTIYTDSERRDTTIGLFDLGRVRAGVGPSFRDAQGVARCGTPGAVIAGCVPINLFGGPAGFTREMLDYATFTAKDDRYKELTSYTANLTGDLFDLPAGPLGFALGYEYRRESGFDQPDALIAAGQSSGNIRQPTRGGFALDELYAEFNLPLLADVPGAEILELSLATRYSDYSNFGDTTNPKLGFRWKPIADLLVRGNWSDGFRAPTVSELFLGQADSFPTIADPCSASSVPTGAVAQRCSQGIGGVSGVPTGYEQANSQIRITVGGNAAALPEQATTRTLGVVYSPSFVEGLDLYLDWYNIEITDVLGVPTGQFLMNQCYLFGNLPSCRLITRGPGGEVLDLFAGVQNNPGIDGLEVEGFDFTVDYRFDTEFGRFRINWDNAYIGYYGDAGQPAFGTVLPSGNASLGNTIGTYQGFPLWRLRSNINLNWQRGDFGATVGARYVSALDESCSAVVNTAVGIGQPQLANLCSAPDVVDPQFGGPLNEMDETWYFDLQGTWDAPWNGRLTIGIRNLFDEDPPVSFSTAFNSFDPQYDVPGRFWYLQYAQRF